MSIIHNALKKTQQELDKNGKKDISRIYDKLRASYQPPQINKEPEENISTEGLKLPRKKKIFPIFTLSVSTFILLVSALCLVYFFFYKQSSSSDLTASAKRKIYSQPVSSNPNMHEPLVLNGIMLKGQKIVALINDDIYEAGEFVDGKEIIKITPEAVQLKDDTNIITLSVRKKK